MPLLLIIEANDERRKSLAAAKLFAKLPRRVFSGDFADSHAVESAVRRIVLLNEDRRIGKIQAVAQTLCVAWIAKRTDLHGKKSARGIDTRRQNFYTHWHDAGADGFDFARSGK